jgi:hypothetical protein
MNLKIFLTKSPFAIQTAVICKAMEGNTEEHQELQTPIRALVSILG